MVLENESRSGTHCPGGSATCPGQVICEVGCHSVEEATIKLYFLLAC